MPTSDYSGEESVYQGGAIAPIRQIAESLGAAVDWDPTTATVKVNGKTVPYDQIRDGRSYGNINMIADAAGGRVVQNADGTYSVYKPRAATYSTTSTPSTAGTAPGSGGTPVTGDGTITATAPSKGIPSASGTERPTAAGGEMQPHEAATGPTIEPFTYEEQPIDYESLQSRAAREAALWAAPQLQALKDLAARYKLDAQNQGGYIRQGLQQDIEDLRAGEVAGEKRIAELMNQRGALYGSGVHLGAVRDQQLDYRNKEYKLTLKAQNALQKLSDSLGLRLADVASREASVKAQEGNRALLSLQQLADKAETRQFENKKATWQMWLQGARLTLDQQTKANELWLNIQRIKSQDDRAAAERELKAAIASGQLDYQYAKLAQDAEQFAGKQDLEGRKLTLQEAEAMSKQTGYIFGLDGKPLLDDQGNMVPTLERAKFDWDKQKFVIAEQDKVDYQNQLLELRRQGMISDAAYKEASLEIRRGELSLKNAELLAKGTTDTSSKAWSSAKSELDGLLDPKFGMTQEEISLGYGQLSPEREQAVHSQRVAAAKAIVSRYYSHLSDQDKAALSAYLKANGLM